MKLMTRISLLILARSRLLPVASSTPADRSRYSVDGLGEMERIHQIRELEVESRFTLIVVAKA